MIIRSMGCLHSAAAIAILLVTHASHPCLAQSKAKVNTEGRVVLANVDRFVASFRVGSVRKDIASRKASLLSPKRFPLKLEVWNGYQRRPAWENQSIAAAGTYLLRYQNGRWTLTKHQPRPAARTARATPSRQPSYRRATGSAGRVARGGGRSGSGGRGPRISLLNRIARDAMGLYRFVRDEADRDLLRDMIIGREIDREIEREILDKLDGLAETLPAAERAELDRAWNGLKDLSESDLKELESATDADWNEVREALGDGVSGDWDALESDFSNIDLNNQDIADLDEAGIDSLDSNIDIGDLDSADVDVGTLDSIDIDELSGGIEDIDVGDLGRDFDGGFDGGGFDGGGFDGGYGGGGFDYDGGGFDDFGGGFDDFGGGFDDFGGGFDF